MRFPVNFAKYLRTPFLTEHLRWLLLNPEIIFFSDNYERFSGRHKSSSFHFIWHFENPHTFSTPLRAIFWYFNYFKDLCGVVSIKLNYLGNKGDINLKW